MNPYVGLRPFLEDDSLYFFGRDEQSTELLRILHESRFLPVIGSSGSGKSSLVIAGLIPKLLGGFLVADRDSWRIATIRPGDGPMKNLANRIRRTFGESEDDEASAAFEQALNDGHTNALTDYVGARLAPNENLLLLVDQFEEIFAYRGSGDDDAETIDRSRHATRAHRREESAAFVDMLISVAERRTQPVYVVLTMRTDFLGDCDVFFGLPEAMNRSQYLVPRMGRRQLGQAINGPTRLMGTSVAPRLLDQLLNDLGDRFDRLPVLQHALLRTWDYWEKVGGMGQVDQEHFDAVGGLESALERDAEEALKGLDQRVVRNVFKALTDTDIRQRRVRRPTLLGDLVNVAGAAIDEIEEIIQRFSGSGRSFLYQRKAQSKADIRVDISHESLIRQWKRLREWVDEERDDRNQYLDLVTQARRRANSTLLLEDNELDEVNDWWQRLKPTADWAARYSQKEDDFAVVKAYVERSRKAAADKILARKLARRRKWYTWTGVTAFLLVVIAFQLVAWGNSYRQALRAKLLNHIAVAKELATEDPTRAVLVATDLDTLDIAQNEFEFVATLHRAGSQPIALASTEEISAAGLSRDGTRAVYGHASGDIEIVRADGTGPVLSSLKTAHGAIASLQFARHDSLVFVGTDSGRGLIWTPASNRVQDLPLDGDDGAGLFHVSDDGARILTHDNKGDLTVWNSADMKPLFKDSAVFDANLSRSGNQLAWLTESGVQVLDLNSRKRTTLTSSTDANGIEISDDDRTVIWADTADVWAWRAGKPPVKASIKAGVIVGMAVGHHGDVFAVVDTGKIIRLFAAATGKLVNAYTGHTADPLHVSFAPDDSTMYSVASDNSVHASKTFVRNSAASFIIRGHSYVPTGLQFSGDGRLLQTFGLDSTARVWRVPSTSPLTMSLGLPVAAADFGLAPAVTALAEDGSAYVVFPAGHSAGTFERLRSGEKPVRIERRCPEDGQFSANLTLRLRCPAEGGVAVQATDRQNADVARIEEPNLRALEVAFAPNGKSLVVAWTSAGKKATTQLRSYDALTGAPKGPFVTLDSALGAIAAVSHDGRHAVVVSDGAKLIDLQSAATPVPLEKFSEENSSTTFSPNDSLIASYGGMSPQLWNTSGKLVGTLVGHQAEVYAFAFSHSGKQIATGGADLTVMTWRTDKLAATRTAPQAQMHGHDRMITSIAFSPNDSLIVSAGTERFVHVWNAIRGKHVMSLPATEFPTIAAFTADGRRVIAVSKQAVVQEWPLRYADIRSILQNATKVCLPAAFRTERLVEDPNDSKQRFDKCVSDRAKEKAVLR